MSELAASELPFQHMPKEARQLHRIRSALRLGTYSLIALAFLVTHALLVNFESGNHLALQATLTFLGIAACILWIVAWPPATWKRRVWRLTPTALEFHHGIIFQHEHQVPRSRVQHTEVTQGPLQRKFNLATLTVYTAGERFADIKIAGLEVGAARTVRDELLKPLVNHVV